MSSNEMDANPVLNKVTALITRVADGHPEFLLFRHPTAGIQIPAGTVEPGEAADDAVIREAIEETDLYRFTPPTLLDVQEETLASGQYCVCQSTPLLHGPFEEATTWGQIPRGVVVKQQHREESMVQVSYEERDLNTGRLMASHIGWVKSSALGSRRRRSFYHLALRESARDTWFVQTDGHRFELFWADPRADGTRESIVAS